MSFVILRYFKFWAFQNSKLSYIYEILIQVALDLWIILNNSECFIILIILSHCLKMVFLSLRVNVLRVPTKEGGGLLLSWLDLDFLGQWFAVCCTEHSLLQPVQPHGHCGHCIHGRRRGPALSLIHSTHRR